MENQVGYVKFAIMLKNNDLFIGDDSPKALEINRHVAPYCATKWRELGEALGMTPPQLDIINVDHPNSCEERCKVMLRKWVKQDVSATWGRLVDCMNTVYCVPCVSVAVQGNSVEAMHPVNVVKLPMKSWLSNLCLHSHVFYIPVTSSQNFSVDNLGCSFMFQMSHPHCNV